MMYPDHTPKEVHVPSDTRRDSFLKAVEARKHSMYRVALMMLRHPADAEDAVSDAVEITWRRLHSIRDLEALPAYLMRSTINACHAVLRKRRRETAMDALEQYLPPVQEETPVCLDVPGQPEGTLPPAPAAALQREHERPADRADSESPQGNRLIHLIQRLKNASRTNRKGGKGLWMIDNWNG